MRDTVSGGILQKRCRFAQGGRGGRNCTPGEGPSICSRGLGLDDSGNQKESDVENNLRPIPSEAETDPVHNLRSKYPELQLASGEA